MSQPLTIRLHANDDVLIAAQQLVPGTAIAAEDLTVRDMILPGHKMAAHDLKVGDIPSAVTTRSSACQGRRRRWTARIGRTSAWVSSRAADDGIGQDGE